MRSGRSNGGTPPPSPPAANARGHDLSHTPSANLSLPEFLSIPTTGGRVSSVFWSQSRHSSASPPGSQTSHGQAVAPCLWPPAIATVATVRLRSPAPRHQSLPNSPVAPRPTIDTARATLPPLMTDLARQLPAWLPPVRDSRRGSLSQWAPQAPPAPPPASVRPYRLSRPEIASSC